MSRPPLVFWLFRTLVNIVAFLFADVALNIAQVFGLILVLLCHFGGIDSNGWMISLTAFLVAFVFLEGLGLSLSLKLTSISRKKIMTRLSPIIPIVLT